ncbi:MAG: DUF2029 domain-containing protein [bacterium]|nr:DUF2029 domain-containing protein [bacterium]
MLFVIFFPFATDLPQRQRWGFFSDEAAYFAVTQSLVHDGDIKYTLKDLQRIRKDFPTGPVGSYLKKGADGALYYAKSFAYPIFAAPFFGLFGVKGLLLFNGLMLFLAVFLAYLLLKQYHPPDKSFGFALVFIFASVIPVYIWWLTADLFNFFMMFTGLFFFFYKFKRPWFFYFSAVFFSAAAFSKTWILPAIGIVYLVLLMRKQWKKFAVLTLISILLFLGFVAYLYVQTGDLSYKLYMGGERRHFGSRFPYESPDFTFEDGTLMSFDNYWDRFYNSPKVFATNLLYYFFGRFTGIFIYFASAFFLLILFFFQRKEPEDWFILAAIVMTMLVFLVLAPDNYFGGSGSVGNRYFFIAFPLFFFLGFKNRLFKFSVVPVMTAIILLSGVYIDSHYHSSTPRLAGMSFPINLFPPEKTQFLSLPTNENPRAFGKLLRDGENTYQVYLINDNYHTIETNSIWSKGDKKLELFLATPAKVKGFEITLVSKKQNNRVSFAIEHKEKTMILNPDKNYVIRFRNIEGLKMKNRYIYHIKIKSGKSYCGYLENPEKDRDKRVLGVNTHIGLVY